MMYCCYENVLLFFANSAEPDDMPHNNAAFIQFFTVCHSTCLQILNFQPRVTVTQCFAYKVIRDLESIDHLTMCINLIRRIGLIHK